MRYPTRYQPTAPRNRKYHKPSYSNGRKASHVSGCLLERLSPASKYSGPPQNVGNGERDDLSSMVDGAKVKMLMRPAVLTATKTGGRYPLKAICFYEMSWFLFQTNIIRDLAGRRQIQGRRENLETKWQTSTSVFWDITAGRGNAGRGKRKCKIH